MKKENEIGEKKIIKKKYFDVKGKKKFFKKKHTKPLGFTNNPEYFGKKPLETSSSSGKRESYSFKGKRKFKNRSNRPKQFIFKRHNKKR